MVNQYQAGVQITSEEDLDLIKSNGKKTCLRCGVEITPENDSGWELFTSPIITQPICKDCEKKEDEKVMPCKPS